VLRLTKAVELVENGIEETLAYYQFPEEHWRRIRTNNPLERILREIRRRTRVVGAFPDGESALNLAAARPAPHRRQRMVDEEIPIDGGLEGSAAEHDHRLSPVRPPLSPNRKCERNWILPR
jgi:transposase-like protein